MRETRGKRVPSFRIGARGIVGQQLHIEAALETRAYRYDYHESLQAYCSVNAKNACAEAQACQNSRSP